MTPKPQILSGSRAIALTVKLLEPAVVSAYPITPQTHIVEDLAAFKADGQADYEYVRAESEFAAASIVLGASAMGLRAYSATSSQGLLLMAEVIFNIAGMRLPVVMTDANRSISAPINIWNDHQDAMIVRDAGWLMLFAENHQEAVTQHILAFKLAEQLMLPVFVNVDGFILTHSYEPVIIPDKSFIKKFVPPYKPETGTYLDTKNPATLGALVTPRDYTDFRQKLQVDMLKSLKLIKKEYSDYCRLAALWAPKNPLPLFKNWEYIDNGFFEYWGPKMPKMIIAVMGSTAGTIKSVLMDKPESNTGILKIRTYRPFPAADIATILKRTKKIAIIDRALSLGAQAPLYADIACALSEDPAAKHPALFSYILGLGGRDITAKTISDLIKRTGTEKNQSEARFL
jgi:pyruvate ferredoxin oxidoreductase alpha subunit